MSVSQQPHAPLHFAVPEQVNSGALDGYALEWHGIAVVILDGLREKLAERICVV